MPFFASWVNEIPIGSRVMLGNMDENVYRTAWAHENITKIGDDLWYAHPFGAFSLDEIKKKFANEAGDISQEYIKENIYIQTIETFKQEK